PAGNLLVAAGSPVARLLELDGATGEVVHRWPVPGWVTEIVQPLGRELVVVGSHREGSLGVLDRATGKLEFQAREPGPRTLAFAAWRREDVVVVAAPDDVGRLELAA